MSGGHFNYDEYKILQIADEINYLISSNDNNEKDEYGYTKGYHFNQDTIEKFKEAESIIRKAYFMTNRIDYLVSGDDGEESFHRRWNDDLRKI